MPARVIIALDKIDNPNCGLGRVAIDFSRALVNLNDGRVDLSFLVFNKHKSSFLKNQKLKKMGFIHRFVPVSLSEYQVFHAIHQLPSFKTIGAGKTVLTIHDLNFLHTKSKEKANAYLRKVQRNVDAADALVFVSHYTKEVCLSFLKIPANKKTCVIYNGVELPKTDPVRPDFFTGEKYLFSIGQFLPKKNFHVLLPFLQKLPEEFKMIIAGENRTSYCDSIRKQIIEKGLQKRIVLAGSVSEAEKLFLYRHCNAFVFPSLAEGFGLPVLEAMRSGKPVFSSDKTSLKEIGGNHAFYWESFDPDNMVQVFRAGMTDFTDQKRKEALEYSLKFSWEENARQYLLLYNSLLP